MSPEATARKNIDRLLQAAGWHVCDAAAANIHAARGVAIREFPLPGHGFADYLLYIDGKAAGVIEAKKEGVTLSGVETQSDKYTQGLPAGLPRWGNPLPFSYQSTGVETRFTNGLDPTPRARPVFAFHKPELLADWLESTQNKAAEPAATYGADGKTFLARLQAMPPLKEEGLWPAQITAINNLEKSLKENRPRALIQMATGSGKTFTSISFIYRLIKFAGARRILFLVDRGNLADQTLKEFQQYVSPYNNFKFSEEYIVQRLQGNQIDSTARVCICTIQRLYSMLKGRDLPADLEEESVDQLGKLFKEPEPIEYNPSIPIETFDIIVTDEAHRSIYNLWAQVLEYFDAYLVGLTATPGKQTFGFFHQNLVMEYNHEMAVADGVNVNYDVYRIKTAITEQGSKVEAGYYVEKQERDTRKTRWEELDDDFAYDPNQLDRDVVTPDQIRTIVRTFRDKLFSEIFPGRTEVPKTLIFAKDDNHAENIVEILREEFGKGNDFAQKITYRTTGATPKELIKAFRNSYHPRVAVTVDMIATGTDIKPVEIVFFMRAVKSRGFFEQMKGRGVRVIKPDDLRAVTPDAQAKDHFVIIDAVGVCEQDKTDARPMEKKPSVSFERLLQAVAFGNTEDEVITSIAGRLARMEHRISAEDDARIRAASGGLGLKDLAHQLVAALSPDLVEAASRRLPMETADDYAGYGFLDPNAPIEMQRANLPHWRQDEASYFVTFRLADSLPKQRLIAWREARADWLTRNPRPWSASQETDYAERFSARIESWLDAGVGSCALANPQTRELMEKALRHFDGERYRLGKYVVAANHVHVIVTPLPGHELSAILHSWKSYTAKQILQSEAASVRLSEGTISIWQKESYDRIVRSSEELFRIEHYIQRHSEYELSAADKRRDAASTAMQQARTIASKPLCDPALRQLILDIKAKNELTIDHVSQDQVIEAGFSQAALDRAKGLVKSFEQFIADHKDEITALQILYSKPYKQRLTFEAVKELADAIEKPPYLWNESQLWQAYAALEASKVKGASAPRILTDLVSLVRFAIHQDNELVPFPERVNANFKAWVEAASRRLAETKRQDAASTGFTPEQMKWLEMIRDHIAANLGIAPDDFEYAPFAQEGGLGKVYQLFGDELNTLIEQLNESLAA
ncbi:MAG: type I restriction-modification enzyme R subunit C-terminal domain-containing protein [Sulfurimicrobium sp.]|nr:type I restriction-modification enzyme R subunit C-terminal domain-containing protein [Sulfurimicrobium sp.]